MKLFLLSSSLRVLVVIAIALLWGCGLNSKKIVIIESSPPGAKVFIDDEFVGTTPLGVVKKQDSQNSTPPSKVALFLEGYYNYQIKVALSNVHHFTLFPYEQNLEIKFTPSPDLLFIDNLPVNPAKKVSLSLPLGTHKIFAYKKNYLFLEHEINLTSSSPLTIKLFFPSEKNRNQLSITGSPLETKVYYKNNLIGVTPIVLRNIPSDPFSLVFKQNHYKDKAVFFRINKGESRVVIARLILKSKPKQIQIVFDNIPIDSQVMLNDIMQIPVFKNQYRNKKKIQQATISAPLDNYVYKISHPGYYQIQGEIRTSTNFENSSQVINLTPITRIPYHPLKILEVPVPSSFDTVQIKNSFFFLSYYAQSRIDVYDLSFNLVGSYNFEEVGNKNIPLLMTGFDYSGIFLLGNRLITSKKIFVFDIGNTGLIDPVYLLPFPQMINQKQLRTAILDNGDHQIKFYDFQKDFFSLQTTLSTKDYFNIDNPIYNTKKEYLLPLRFAQAVRINRTNEKGEEKNQIIFTDIVNHDIKSYDVSSQSVGYFFSAYEKRPNTPYAIGRYHDLILVADKTQNKIWVYDKQGNFIHDFILEQTTPIRYLFTNDKRLYALGDKKVSIYFLR